MTLSPEWQAYCDEAAANAARIRAYLPAYVALLQGGAMKHGPENELPPHTDAAHRDPATGLQLAGDTARTLAAMRRQVEACEAENTDLKTALAHVTGQWEQAEAHNNDLNDDLAQLRVWQIEQRARAKDELQHAPPGDSKAQSYWRGQIDALDMVGLRLKPVV